MSEYDGSINYIQDTLVEYVQNPLFIRGGCISVGRMFHEVLTDFKWLGLQPDGQGSFYVLRNCTYIPCRTTVYENSINRMVKNMW